MGKGVVVAVASTAAAVLLGAAAWVLRPKGSGPRRQRLSSSCGRSDSIKWYNQQPTFTLTNQCGMDVTVSCVGAAITKVSCADGVAWPEGHRPCLPLDARWFRKMAGKNEG